jgi:histidinol-phosphate aminotransferase
MDRRNFLRFSTLLAGTPLLNMPAAYAHETACTMPMSDPKYLALGSNENPYGPSPMAIKAMREAVTMGNRYTDTWDLKEKIAKKQGILSENIILGAGSAEILGLIALAYFKAKTDALVVPRPTFFVLPNMFERLGGKLIDVPLTADKKHDLERMASAVTPDTKLVYVCNPNNPTGTKLDPSVLKAFVEEMSKKCVVAIDEVYHDFINDPSLIPLAAANKNIIVVRSFSKVYGLAGMRVGYGVGHPETVAYLSKYVAWAGNAISQVTQAAALSSLDDVEFIKMSLAKNEESKAILYDYLEKTGIEYYKSYANCSYFSLDKLPKGFVKTMFDDKKIVVRQVEDYGKSYCRVSSGKPEEMTLFINAIKSL